jgi:superfamily I DNA/RNA helicase
VSLLTGADPVVKACKDEPDEISNLALWIEEMIQLGYDQGDIAVFARRTRTLSAIGEPALRMVQGLKRRDLQDSRLPGDDGISFGTMHRAKGLEFKAVAVVGCGENDIPDLESLASAGDEADRDEILEEELNLLHVAITRPRERLYVSFTGESSRFLPARSTRGPDSANDISTD